MPLNVRCEKCREYLDEPGGLAFSPPVVNKTDEDGVFKYHLCAQCWVRFMRWVSQT